MRSFLTANRRTIRRLSWVWLFASLAIGGYLLATAAPSAPAKHDFLSRTDPPRWAVATRATTLPIETIRVGMRVLGSNPDASEVDETSADPNSAQWRKLSLRMAKDTGDSLNIELLRPLEWLSFYEVAVGRTIDLDLSEMGADGPAEILAVEPCPPIQPGRGNVVTGTFAHRSSGNLINLQVTGEPRPIGVTRNHRYWSEDREEFVAAGDLRVGERLQAATGQLATVVAITPRPADEPVYNLEVHQQHVYRVGRLGALVHNSYGGDEIRGNIVYRVIRDDENPLEGLTAKLPRRGMTIEGHIGTGSRNRGSQFLSTTLNEATAIRWAQRDGKRVVKIDLSRLTADDGVQAFDVSTQALASRFIRNPRTRNLATGSQEVLITGKVNASAVEVIHDFRGRR